MVSYNMPYFTKRRKDGDHMKKIYEKPTVLCEHMMPEAVCSACVIRNPVYNEAQQCGYELDSKGITLFVDGWSACMPENNGSLDELYCYQPGTLSLFGS